LCRDESDERTRDASREARGCTNKSHDEAMFVSYGFVIFDSKFFEKSRYATMFIADITGSNSGVDEAFAPRHAVKEKFTLIKALCVVRVNESM